MNKNDLFGITDTTIKMQKMESDDAWREIYSYLTTQEQTFTNIANRNNNISVSKSSEDLFYTGCVTNDLLYVVEHTIYKGCTIAVKMRGGRLAYYHNDGEILDYINALVNLYMHYYVEPIGSIQGSDYNTQYQNDDYTFLQVCDSTYCIIGPLLYEFFGDGLNLAIRAASNFYIFYTKTHFQEHDQYVSRDQIGFIFTDHAFVDPEDEDISYCLVNDIGTLWEKGDCEFIQNNLDSEISRLFPMNLYERQETQWNLFDIFSDRLRLFGEYFEEYT
jgi:hypothetical protein